MLSDYARRRGQHADRYETLSAREREIFQLVAEGKANKDIAALLSISSSRWKPTVAA